MELALIMYLCDNNYHARFILRKYLYLIYFFTKYSSKSSNFLSKLFLFLKILREQAELLLKTLCKIRRRVKSYHIADFIYFIIVLFQ